MHHGIVRLIFKVDIFLLFLAAGFMRFHVRAHAGVSSLLNKPPDVPFCLWRFVPSQALSVKDASEVLINHCSLYRHGFPKVQDNWLSSPLLQMPRMGLVTEAWLRCWVLSTSGSHLLASGVSSSQSQVGENEDGSTGRCGYTSVWCKPWLRSPVSAEEEAVEIKMHDYDGGGAGSDCPAQSVVISKQLYGSKEPYCRLCHMEGQSDRPVSPRAHTPYTLGCAFLSLWGFCFT